MAKTYKKLTGNNGVQFTATATEYQASGKCSELVSSNTGNNLTTGNDGKLYVGDGEFSSKVLTIGVSTYGDLAGYTLQGLWNVCFIATNEDGADVRIYRIGSKNGTSLHVYRMDYNGLNAVLTHKVISTSGHESTDVINFV